MKKLMQWVSQKIRVFVYSRFFLFVLGVVIGAVYMFCFYEGKAFCSEIMGFKVHGTMVSTAVHAMPSGEISGLTGDDTGSETAPSLKEITRKVYQLESSSGKNGTDQGCHAKGLHNGYGYAPGSCYESDEATGEIVSNWFDAKLKNGLTLDAALCLYNEGVPMNHCEYSEMFYTL